jgi:TetR/AcrR family transcriptional regulator, fatty acid metabolism regulator protein
MEYTKKQQKILDATIDIIMREGIDKITTRRIAKELKITDPALYNHFESKDDILAAVCTEALEKYEGVWEQIDLLEGRGLERIRQIFLSWCKNQDQNPRISYIQKNAEVLFRGLPELTGKFVEYAKRDQEFIVTLVREAQRLGEVRDDMDPKDIMLVMVGAFGLSFTKWLTNGFSYSLYEQGKHVWLALNALINPYAGVKKVVSGEPASVVLKL